MDRQYVDSSMIISIGYDSSVSTLEIEFSSGVIWDYPDFPEYLWYEFLEAGSKGGFFNQNIRKQYTPTGYRVN